MKKTLLVLVIYLFTITTFSQVYNLKTTLFSFKVSGKEWNEWVESDIEIKHDVDNKKIIIYNSLEQTVEYVNLDIIKINNVILYEGYGTDSDLQTVKIYIWVFNDNMYLHIKYSDLEYIYEMKVTKEKKTTLN